MLFIVQVAIELAFEHLLDATLLELLQKTVELVPGLELFQEIVVEQFFFLHNVQIFKIRQKISGGMPPLIFYLHTLWDSPKFLTLAFKALSLAFVIICTLGSSVASLATFLVLIIIMGIHSACSYFFLNQLNELLI